MPKALWPVPAAVFFVIWGLTTHGKYSVTGDEPHYLLMTESLRSDGDVDLRNDYASRASEDFGAPNLQRELHAQPDRKGAIRSVHEPGLAVLILPAYVAARELAQTISEARLRSFRMSRGLFTYALVSLFQTALTCAALALLLDALRQQSTPWIGTIVTAAVGLAPPVLSVGFLVFPEVPAFLIVCFALWTCWGRGASSKWTPLVAATVIGTLPWFHRKFTLFALGLLFVLLWQRCRGEGRSRRTAVTMVVLFAVPVAAFHLYTLVWWGHPLGPLAVERLPLSWSAFAVGAPGLLIDRENGLLVWGPIYLLAGAAWWKARVWSWPLLVPAAALFVPAAAHDMWWGGFAPAARFLLPLAPFFALVIASAMREPAFPRLFAVLCAVQAFISAIGWQWPRTLWPRGDGHNRMLESIPLVGETINEALPSFRTGAADAFHGALGLTFLFLISAALVRAATTRRGPAPRNEAPSVRNSGHP